MNFKIFHDRRSMGKAAADQAAAAIRFAIQDHGSARIVAATAAAQKEFLEELASAPPCWIERYIPAPSGQRL